MKEINKIMLIIFLNIWCFVYFSLIMVKGCKNSISDELTFKYDSLAHSMMLPCEHCEAVNVILTDGKVNHIVVKGDKYEYNIYIDSLNVKYK